MFRPDDVNIKNQSVNHFGIFPNCRLFSHWKASRDRMLLPGLISLTLLEFHKYFCRKKGSFFPAVVCALMCACLEHTGDFGGRGEWRGGGRGVHAKD